MPNNIGANAQPVDALLQAEGRHQGGQGRNLTSDVTRPSRATPKSQKTAIRPGGLEPPTLGLEIPCSIRLSYGRKVLKYKDLRNHLRGI